MHQPKPFFRAQRNQWEVEYERGKRRRLCSGPKNSQTEAEAWREYHRLMASLGLETEIKPHLTVELACDLFLTHAEKSVSHGAYEQYRIKLQDFADHYGSLKLDRIRPRHVNEWVAKHEWSQSTVRGAITSLKTCFAWLVREGHLPTDPLKHVKRPKMGRRTRTVTRDERHVIGKAVSPEFRDYLNALAWSGARPGEITRLEAGHVDFETGIARLPGKTTRKTGEMITLVMVPQFADLCRALAEKNPSGPIFRNTKGKPWTTNAVKCAMRRLRDEMKEQGVNLDGVTAYAFRHSFATDALEKGVPLADVAALMNHRDIRTTMNYNHIEERTDHLRRQAGRAISDDASESGS